MRNADTDKIVNVLDGLLGSFNISDMRKINDTHQQGWKEYLNGNSASQLEASKKQTEVLTSIIEALPDSTIDFIMRLINK